jgi:hypothetical protein
MIQLKTNVNTKACYSNDHEPARAGTIRALLGRPVLPRLMMLGLSGLLLTAGSAAADEVTDWNHIMLEATLYATPTVPATPAPISTRSTAIVQAAVFDAVNGLDPHYTPICSAHRSTTRFETCCGSASHVCDFDPPVSGTIRHAR